LKPSRILLYSSIALVVFTIHFVYNTQNQWLTNQDLIKIQVFLFLIYTSGLAVVFQFYKKYPHKLGFAFVVVGGLKVFACLFFLSPLFFLNDKFYASVYVLNFMPDYFILLFLELFIMFKLLQKK